MEEGVHPIPFRTRKLSPPSPMILRTLAWESRPMPALIFTGMRNRIPTHHAKGPGEKSPGPSCVCRRGRAVAAYDWAIATVLLGARRPLALRALTVLPLSAWPAYPSVSRFYLSFCPTMGPRAWVACRPLLSGKTVWRATLPGRWHASQEHPACAVATWAACMEWHIRGWGREGRKAEAMNRRVRCCACVSEGGDPQPAYRFFLRHSHGGVGLRVFHSPMLVCRALLAAKYQARQG